MNDQKPEIYYQVVSNYGGTYSVRCLKDGVAVSFHEPINFGFSPNCEGAYKLAKKLGQAQGAQYDH